MWGVEFKWTAFLYTEGALDMLHVTAGADSSCLPELAFRLNSKFFSPLLRGQEINFIRSHLITFVIRASSFYNAIMSDSTRAL